MIKRCIATVSSDIWCLNQNINLYLIKVNDTGAKHAYLLLKLMRLQTFITILLYKELQFVTGDSDVEQQQHHEYSV